ncbi:uncharacterized protein F5Z01DRAFT_659028 [Emericellopsis atlantica]|uniref:Uncharacterized protein n=1 Tax=Emericellopsis atlantica TaxID=2614577 RepID=A0A9P7ZJ47_9HYPO|nr:uncharacterized protein F5Z01DRAFT_659028 [Emericellopsis atlantica]KAG9253044.1 hypothetical protein F5Z01DRAFT_659028 [Emericellopsis atlantica]
MASFTQIVIVSAISYSVGQADLLRRGNYDRKVGAAKSPISLKLSTTSFKLTLVIHLNHTLPTATTFRSRCPRARIISVMSNSQDPRYGGSSRY